MVPKQVYWVNQTKSRNNTNPSIPLDPDKPKRMFLILSTMGNTVTCCPLNTVTGHNPPGMTEHRIDPNKYSWLSGTTHVFCNLITTLNKDCFNPTMAGAIDDIDMAAVKTSIKTHLRIK